MGPTIKHKVIHWIFSVVHEPSIPLLKKGNVRRYNLIISRGCHFSFWLQTHSAWGQEDGLHHVEREWIISPGGFPWVQWFALMKYNILPFPLPQKTEMPPPISVLWGSPSLWNKILGYCRRGQASPNPSAYGKLLRDLIFGSSANILKASSIIIWKHIGLESSVDGRENSFACFTIYTAFFMFVFPQSPLPSSSNISRGVWGWSENRVMGNPVHPTEIFWISGVFPQDLSHFKLLDKVI